jgi:hypothetical protein
VKAESLVKVRFLGVRISGLRMTIEHRESAVETVAKTGCETQGAIDTVIGTQDSQGVLSTKSVAGSQRSRAPWKSSLAKYIPGLLETIGVRFRVVPDGSSARLYMDNAKPVAHFNTTAIYELPEGRMKPYHDGKYRSNGYIIVLASLCAVRGRRR